MPPEPVQAKVKVLSPVLLIVNSSLPEVSFEPSQAPDAEHELALVDDQVRVVALETKTESGSALKLTVGAGGGVGGGVGVELPPPPPPQEARTKTADIVKKALPKFFIRTYKLLFPQLNQKAY